MWPIGCFVWFALAVNVVRALAPHARRRFGARLSSVRRPAFAAAVAILAIMPIAVAFADSARPDDAPAEDAVGRLAAQLQPRLARGVPYQLDVRTDQLFIGGAVQNGLFRELARRGFDTRVGPSDDYLGRSHAAPRDAVHLVICAGRRIRGPDGARVRHIGRVVLASTVDRARMRRLDTELRDFLTTPVNLTARGRELIAGTFSESDADAQVLHRLLDPASDDERANNGLVAL